MKQLVWLMIYTTEFYFCHNSLLVRSLYQNLYQINSWRTHWMRVVTATSQVQFSLAFFLLIVPTFCKWMSFSRELFHSSSHPKAALKDSSVAANSYVWCMHSKPIRVQRHQLKSSSLRSKTLKFICFVGTACMFCKCLGVIKYSAASLISGKYKPVCFPNSNWFV